MYKAVTRGISVTVEPRFMPEESSPDDGRYFFAYAVEIINTGPERVQLRVALLENHRRQRANPGGARGRSGRKAAGARSGRKLQLHQRVPADDDERHHGGQLRDGNRLRRDFRRHEIPAFSLDMPLMTKRVVH